MARLFSQLPWFEDETLPFPAVQQLYQQELQAHVISTLTRRCVRLLPAPSQSGVGARSGLLSLRITARRLVGTET